MSCWHGRGPSGPARTSASQPSSMRCVAYERRSECISNPAGNSRSLQYRRNRRSSVFFGDECASLAGEQIKPVIQVGLAVGQPVGDHLAGPSEHRQHAAPLGRGSLLRLAVTDLDHPVTAELPAMRITGEVHRLQVAQFVEPQPVGVGDLEHRRVPVGRQPALARRCGDQRTWSSA